MAKKEKHNYIKDFLFALTCTLSAHVIISALIILYAIDWPLRGLAIFAVCGIVPALSIMFLFSRNKIVNKYKLDSWAFSISAICQWLVFVNVFALITNKMLLIILGNDSFELKVLGAYLIIRVITVITILASLFIWGINQLLNSRITK